MASYKPTTESMDTATSACVMVLGTQGETRDNLVKLLADMGHACVSTNAINGVRDRMAADTAFDLLMIDGSIGQEGLKLIREAQAADPCVRALVYGNGANPTDVVDAIRAGASDYISLPRDIARLPERTEQVLDRVRAHRARERRVADLSEACAKLKATRDEMSERVDTLCGDLASAYRTMREQISDVALASEFRALLSQELDLEAMLRTALEAMIQRIGPINAVVFLQESTDNWGVGAYVNYQWQDRDIMPMLTRLGQIIGPGMAAEHGLVRFDDASEFAAAEGGDMELLNGTEVAAFSCHRGDECLAVFTLLRDAEEGFDDEHAASIDVMRTIVAEQLSRILRVHRRNSSQWPEEPSDDSWGMAA